MTEIRTLGFALVLACGSAASFAQTPAKISVRCLNNPSLNQRYEARVQEVKEEGRMKTAVKIYDIAVPESTKRDTALLTEFLSSENSGTQGKRAVYATASIRLVVDFDQGNCALEVPSRRITQSRMPIEE